jgi:hypothetical protein
LSNWKENCKGAYDTMVNSLEKYQKVSKISDYVKKVKDKIGIAANNNNLYEIYDSKEYPPIDILDSKT